MSEMWKYAASKNISSGPNSAPSQPGLVLSWSWTIGSCEHCWAPLAPLGTCAGHLCWATFSAICKYTYANCRLIVVMEICKPDQIHSHKNHIMQSDASVGRCEKKRVLTMQKSGPGGKMQKAKLAGEVKFRHPKYQTGRKTSTAWNA